VAELEFIPIPVVGCVSARSSDARTGGDGDGTRCPPTYSSSKKDMRVGVCPEDSVGVTASLGAATSKGGADEDSLASSVMVVIMKAVPEMVGEVFAVSPAPRHWASPRTKVEPPGGWFGLVAFRISAVKLCGCPAITLHWAEV
jgi:hypothetical protein